MAIQGNNSSHPASGSSGKKRAPELRPDQAARLAQHKALERHFNRKLVSLAKAVCMLSEIDRDDSSIASALPLRSNFIVKTNLDWVIVWLRQRDHSIGCNGLETSPSVLSDLLKTYLRKTFPQGGG